MLTQNDSTYLIKQAQFWDKLNPEEQELLLNNAVPISYPKGSSLHSPDRECLGVVLVKSGELRISILSEDGRDITLYRLLPGDFCVLSASCILNAITFDVHIEAETDSDTILINAAFFSKLSSQNVYVENFAYKNAVERFSDVMWAMEQILFMKLDQRLAIFLLDEMAKNNTQTLTLTQEQIARYIGSAREAVSRMLKTFQSQGILEQSRGTIRILNKEKLRELL